MELFTVSLISASTDAVDRLHRSLNDEFVDLHNVQDTIGDVSVAFTPNYESKEIQCNAGLPEFKLPVHGPLVYRKAATAFARYILTEIEPLLLRAIIRKQFHYDDPKEVEMVEQYCRNLLFSGIPSSLDGEGADSDMLQIDRERRQNKVAAEIEAFLAVNTRIHLDGFVTFRLASYWEELREVAAFAVDEYMMDKQYQEFISLLKYFVRIQEVKLPIVHVLHRGGSEFALYDEQFQLLEAAPADRIVAEMLESEMNMEDMIVSTLITVAPHQIVIHTRHPELQVMRTLETIFEQRVQLCVECSRCSFFFNEANQPAPAVLPKQINAKRIRT
ncbi:putative sporulation protein YtxC [Paenibacillus sp. sptzw28]|uniref:putative sporulation protein YtxC n=1 Tax=Paenibacillus sp. sptzw28 TaxID=715179 RepID=UPI001C6EE4F3|nr:putative sporulation protein YtxC [Paenibacillus sp. sptzw28]QYR20473.1 putative sporulation protein YtxC [Paenibacillus sp. sptzw28]